jgi:hypothetical protein
LRAAIEAFKPHAEKHGWHTAEDAENSCNQASDDFLHFLEAQGIEEGEIEHYERQVILDRKDYPFNDLDGCYYHWAVRVGDHLVDWTARQFDALAPFPAVWKGERREWRNSR